MKKWPFWCSMFAVLLLHGGIFFKASANAMGRGLDGADNQAGLLFVPILWIAAVYVLAALVVLTLVRGRGIAKDQTISVLELFRLSGCSAKEKTVKTACIMVTCLLMLFGYSLFARETLWAMSYALSGGVLLLSLCAWEKASAQSGRTTG